MRVIREEVIEGQVVDVDGKHFVGCTLIDCILQYGGGVVVMEGTMISRCHHIFLGSARLTINYLEAMGLITPDKLTPRPEDIIQ